MTLSSMPCRLAFLFPISAWAFAAHGASAGVSRIEAGEYEVAVRLELPHVEDSSAQKTATICVTSASDNANHGLTVLSENNPLATCPISNVRENGDTLTFDIKCPGGNAAIASAKYSLKGHLFHGRITMKMGGKNMTMTETQVGRRIGACQANPPRI